MVMVEVDGEEEESREKEGLGKGRCSFNGNPSQCHHRWDVVNRAGVAERPHAEKQGPSVAYFDTNFPRRRRQ